MQNKTIILDYTKDELAELIKPAFRAKQVYGWMYHKYAKHFDEMQNIPKTLRAELDEKFILMPLTAVQKEQSKDGTIKYLFALPDGKTIEAVLLLMKPEELGDDGEVTSEAKYTVCVSTQVGCKVGCTFCLTAKGGFTRNLTPGEIVAQVLAIKIDNNIPAAKRMNIVYMGMGEPLDNLDNLATAIKIFTSVYQYDISKFEIL